MNVDETPLPWEYLIGRTDNLPGAKTIWSKSADSSTEKRKCTMFLYILADGFPRVPPILIFTATTGDKIGQNESHLWDKRVQVECKSAGLMNGTVFCMFILLFLISIFGNPHSLFVYDLYRAHLTPAVIQSCHNNNISPSLIPAGKTLLTQPFHVVINKSFKNIIKEFTEEDRE